MATVRLGDIAPDFKAKTSQGEISFHQWLGNNWGLLFSHPADFTPVCTTELGRTAKLKDEFDKQKSPVIAQPFMKGNFALRSFCFKIGRDVP